MRGHCELFLVATRCGAPQCESRDLNVPANLWHAYLSARQLAVRGLRPDDVAFEALNNTYERALVTMHKMPRIWLQYLQLLMEQRLVTRTRRTFDRALASLPITQHDRVWQLYLGRWEEAAQKLAELLNDDTFRSLEGKSKHALWLELCDIITKHPKDVSGMRVDAILRGGIRRFTDEVGRLWTSLADFYIRRSMFEKARDVYEEGLCSVLTVHDFSLIYDAYTQPLTEPLDLQFEESLLSASMEQLAEDDEDGMAVDDDDGADFLLKDDGNDVDLRLARLEHLMNRRPELLSSVILRQNPHNVAEWHKRVKLFEGKPTKQILTYTEAVRTVDPDKATGKPHSLWCAFAKFYERHGDVPNARIIFQKATEARYKYVDDLAQVWCEWVEMELRHSNFKRALDLVKRVLTPPPRPARMTQEEERALPVQDRVYRNLKLHLMHTDLEESLGTRESTCEAYDRILELRIATPQVILNYALFLTEQKAFEDAFKVYERGIALFKYPHVKDIWSAYLAAFVDRYGGKKLERARDLYEQAIKDAPAQDCKSLYLDYAKLEETHGLARHAMDIYARALQAVPKDQRKAIIDIYVREIYESAIEAEPPNDLSDDDVRELCMRYAALETKLGEIDRARAIYVHGSAVSHPDRAADYWAAWRAFEVRHGNEDTFKEMMRILRSVKVSFSHMQINSIVDAARITSRAEAEAGVGAGAKRAREGVDAMAELEAEAVAAMGLGAAAGGAGSSGRTALSGFVSAGVIQQGGEKDGTAADGAQPQRKAPAAANPEEIDLDADDDDGGAAADMDVAQKAVPAAVFGGFCLNVFAECRVADAVVVAFVLVILAPEQRKQQIKQQLCRKFSVLCANSVYS
ncbi:hypothetical protein VOLCADRAFT_103670 [Volvox carteri f. nagariensis]|uniref:Uncharacterized protein n=1 Tax=Volvox carteri f. nagariensis TaxID=3068 RepID=D8TNP7_VOLCA|nr:uncharacterized protein VOLCADRAFT_103670 [Volvox carteri f. nagariensis]EFJ51030.1 hypothetical protein VOLCADRAFT_103670 [Volvox carteri f. nagariensis]|eukprot:XP_002948042.1 hypothetical protein VOLCADRAFT_103670 [Volvox carteri f. nagariensis]